MRRNSILGAAALVVGAFAVLALQRHAHPGPDPDRWFHFAVSALMSHGQLLRTLPQVEDLGWGRAFIEPYFLFHAATTAGYRLAGTFGVVAVAHLLALGTILFVYALACAWVPPLQAAGLSAALLFSSPYFSARLTEVRPHLAAMLCFMLLVGGVLRRKPGAIFVGALCFALAYHAYYIPVIVLAAAVLTARRDERATLALAGLSGLAVGIIANPYFPGSMTGAVEQLRIALAPSAGDAGMAPGRELAALSPASFFWAFSLCLVALAAAVFSWFRIAGRARGPLSFLLTAAGAFWLITLRSPRGCEYAIPLTVLATAAASSTLKELWQKNLTRKKPAAVVAAAVLAAVGLVGPGRYLAGELFGAPETLPAELTRATLQALSELPDSATGQKILNCQWTLGAFVLYSRPDMRFVDTLHPLLLKFADPALYEALRRMKLARETDLVSRMQELFHADYVLCDLPTLNAELESDPRVRVIYHDATAPVGLYALGPAEHPALVGHYEATLIPGETSVSDDLILEHFRARHPQDGAELETRAPDFLAQFGAEPTGQTRCVWARPTAAELDRHVGAREVDVGGGPHVRLWFNGKRVYASEPYLSDPKMIQATARLPRSLRHGDRLEAVVCRRNADFWSLALWLR